jgi:DNA (cytosine-5)-methyltransferase 1
MRAIDCFCGAGGLTRGLLDAGVLVVAGFDIDGRCKKTYERNNRPVKFYRADVSSIDPTTLWEILGSRRATDLLLAGCSPCQPFSQHKNGNQGDAQRNARGTDPDSTLLGAFARLVGTIKPGQVLIENVPGLTRVRGFSTYRRFVRLLLGLGYNISEEVLDAKNFGVPQTRRRYVLIAIRGRPAAPPEPTFGPGLTSYSTVRDAISHFPPIRAGERHHFVPNHEAAALSDINLRRLSHTPHDGGDRRAWPSELVLDCHKGDHDGHTDVYGRMSWDKPAPTLTGKCHSISNGRYGHPVQDRAISLREAASLQTFPDSYIFYGPRQHIARMIGNSVPVRLGEALGRHILSLRYGRETRAT